MKTIIRNRPLVALAIAMAVAFVISAIAAVFDQRMLTGMNIWFKPMKFEISIGIYAVTLAWLIAQLTTFHRLARVVSVVTAIGLVIEMVIIFGCAALGETSHFNVSTPTHVVLWAVMAVSITIVWMMTLLVVIALFRAPLGDRARTIAIRAGLIISLVGMALAFLMTSPTAAQLDNLQGIVGAHAVGVPDGGPGLPILGWSTVAGDLRIPHFVGMHALQLLPLGAIVVELTARRLPRVLRPAVRAQLLWLAAAVYLAVVGILTWQAVIGQSIVRPSGLVLIAGIAVAAAALTGALSILVTAGARARCAESQGFLLASVR